MRIVTATEARRSFAALLDDVEHGETVIVTRGRKRIATIGPAAIANGGPVLAMLQESNVDEGFEVDVLTARGPVESETTTLPKEWSSTTTSRSGPNSPGSHLVE